MERSWRLMSLASHPSTRFRTMNYRAFLSCYFIFDVMILAGRDVTKLPLEARQELVQAKARTGARTFTKYFAFSLPLFPY